MKQVEKYHLLASLITNEVYIGTIKKQLGKGYSVSDNKINRNTAFCNEYSNQSNILSLYNWSE